MTHEMDPELIRAMTPAQRAEYAKELGRDVLRFAQLRPNWGAFGEARLPGNHRALFHYVGTGAAEDPTGIGARPGLNCSFSIVVAPPGNGAPLHAHTTEEIFLVLSGRWGVYWGEPGEQEEVLLDQWDGIVVPAPVMRGFRNAGTQDAYLLALLGGGAPPPPIYHPSVLERFPTPPPHQP